MSHCLVESWILLGATVTKFRRGREMEIPPSRPRTATSKLRDRGTQQYPRFNKAMAHGHSDPVLTEVEGPPRFPRHLRLSLLLAALREVFSDNKTLPE